MKNQIVMHDYPENDSNKENNTSYLSNSDELREKIREDLPDLPVIHVTGADSLGILFPLKANEVADKAMSIITSGDPDSYLFFYKDGNLGRVSELYTERLIARNKVKKVYETTFKQFDKDGIQSYLNSIANFVKFKKKNEEIVPDPQIAPTLAISKDILERDWDNVPILDKITTHPTFDRNWNLINKDGYNKDSLAYLVKGSSIDLQELSLEEAYRTIVGWLSDFPFKDYSDFCNCLALLVTLATRTAFPEGQMAPLFIITANHQTAGKSTLADVLTGIVLGEMCAKEQLPKDEAETNKVIGSQLLAGFEVTIFDNLSGGWVISSDGLASSVTEPKIRWRLLGQSKMITSENNMTFILTGNNIGTNADLASRALFIRLDVDKNAEDRVFEFESIAERTISEPARSLLFSAVYTIIKEWDKQSEDDELKYGEANSRFEYFGKVCNGIINMLDRRLNVEKHLEDGTIEKPLQHFLKNKEQLKRESDPEYSAWCDLKDADERILDENGISFSEIFSIASFRKEHDDIDLNLLGTFFKGSDHLQEAMRRTALGQYLKKNDGRLVENYKFEVITKGDKKTYRFRGVW